MAAPSSVLSPGAGAPSAGTTLCELIRKYEGCRLKAYLCPAGIPTIGWGSTGWDVQLGMTWTREQADARLERDAAAVLVQAMKLSPVLAHHPSRLASVADFIYNCGSGRYKASTLKRKIDVRAWEEAAQEFGKWVWGGGKKLPGLVARRADEALLMRAGYAK